MKNEIVMECRQYIHIEMIFDEIEANMLKINLKNFGIQ